ncbi:MAG TPA: hypothetical protein PLP88_00890, partial [Bacteroidales bacterium]|nr:hypothetical protein [Bacteroidales bacterium]
MQNLAKFLATAFICLILVNFSRAQENIVTLQPAKAKTVINKNIYGHFAEHLGHCIYEGIWVGENSAIPNVRGIRTDVVTALREMAIPNLRWPGGCFADEYHWKNGIGPSEKRPTMINTNWGGVTEDNSFGTNEFLDLCEQLGQHRQAHAHLRRRLYRRVSPCRHPDGRVGSGRLERRQPQRRLRHHDRRQYGRQR